MLEKIKEGLKSLVYFFRGRSVPITESMAIKLTLLACVLIFVFLIIIIKFTLPKTSLEIEISGPKVAKAGELITYTVSCKNTGNVTIENPELIFNYPAHSLPEKRELIERVSSDKFEGPLYPGAVKTFQFKTRLFGTSGEKEEVKYWLSYNIKRAPSLQISPVFTFSTQISEVPIDLELDLPSKISVSPKTKAELEFGIRYASFIDYSLSNLKIKINYPSDFNLKESKPEIAEGNQWEIPTLEKNETGEIEILGEFLAGQEIGKELNFSAQLSIPIYGEEVLLKKIVKDSVTQKPIFLFSQKINSKSEYIPSPGERLHYQIYFKNIQEEPLRNLVLISTLKGDLYDLSTIESPRGEFELGDNSIVWSGEKISELQYLQPEEAGEVEFWIKLKSDYRPKSITETNAVIKNKISIGGFEKEFRTKVNSKLEISQEGYFEDKYGFFENSGYPPQVNKTTSYTLVWKINNYYNLVKNVEIKASLPPQVSVKSIRPPSQGKIDVRGEYSEKESAYPGIPADFRFEEPLYYEMTSGDVVYLKIILKKEVPHLVSKNIGFTKYFGEVTLKAVKGFQEKYKTEILSPQGLKEGTGFVDELTRLKLNELLTKGAPVTTKEIVWEIEKIEPGVGIFSGPWTTAFQITLTPTLAQKGKLAELISEATFSGKDQWTGEIIFTKDGPIDTSLPDDSTIKNGKIR